MKVEALSAAKFLGLNVPTIMKLRYALNDEFGNDKLGCDKMILVLSQENTNYVLSNETQQLLADIINSSELSISLLCDSEYFQLVTSRRVKEVIASNARTLEFILSMPKENLRMAVTAVDLQLTCDFMNDFQDMIENVDEYLASAAMPGSAPGTEINVGVEALTQGLGNITHNGVESFQRQ